jgi:YceI-like domain
VASHDTQGFVAPDDSRSDLFVRLDTLVVDEADLRADAGLDKPPAATLIAGTRQNMLEKVLDADQFPFASISIRGVDRSVAPVRLDVSITLHGTTRSLDVPVQLVQNADQLHVTGSFTLLQSDFGITPFAILGGAIAVRDQLDVRFDVRAERVSAVVSGRSHEQSTGSR